MYTKLPTWEPALEGPNLLAWVEREETENWPRAKQAALFPLRPLPHIQPGGLPRPGEHLRLLPFYYITGKRKMAQMKERIKAQEKNTTQQQRDSQPIRCTVQNTGNQDAHRNG